LCYDFICFELYQIIPNDIDAEMGCMIKNSQNMPAKRSYHQRMNDRIGGSIDIPHMPHAVGTIDQLREENFNP
jgi:hypothetical protein